LGGPRTPKTPLATPMNRLNAVTGHVALQVYEVGSSDPSGPTRGVIPSLKSGVVFAWIFFAERVCSGGTFFYLSSHNTADSICPPLIILTHEIPTILGVEPRLSVSSSAYRGKHALLVLHSRPVNIGKNALKTTPLKF